ncbi:hypothetical protein GCM10009665_13490 [Kitasatospora nipponensis]|uniref:DUF4232 domain-containing protein n=1 Tax=Kitasatospora nipponensis TaxID=258049 RepID=A0ABN1VV60_9ACTN
MKPNAVRLGKGAAVAATTLALVLGAAACNDDTPSTNGSSPAASTAASASAKAPGAGSSAPSAVASAAASGAATGGKASPSAAGSGAAAASDRCHTGDLKADVQIQAAGLALVALTNKSTHSCTVHGYLGYGGLQADNSPLTVATARVPFPGPAVDVTLKPGTSAFSGLKWVPCDKSDASCKVLAGVTVTPPDETTRFTASVLGTDGKAVPQITVSAAGFTVGTLQSVTQGVVFG